MKKDAAEWEVADVLASGAFVVLGQADPELEAGLYARDVVRAVPGRA